MRMRLLFEPVDVLFFRDSKPFAAGAQFDAESTEPLPSVFYGALRTHLLRRAGVDFARYKDAGDPADWPVEAQRSTLATLGTPARAGTMRLAGPWFRHPERGMLYPVPADLRGTESARGAERYSALARLESCRDLPEGWDWSPPLPTMRPLWHPGRDLRGLGGSLIDEAAMRVYLEGGTPDPDSLVDRADICGYERRVGIAVDSNRRTAQEGMLYAAQYLRLAEGAAFACDIEGLEDFPEDGHSVALGGDRRLARVRIEKAAPAVAPEIRGGAFAVMLATPALFDRGWRPGWIDDAGEGVVPGVGARVRLVAAAVGKPLAFSGWDLARGCPKPIRRAVPAGSVYRFEVLDGDAGEIARVLHGRSVSDVHAEAGFGVAFVGAAPRA